MRDPTDKSSSKGVLLYRLTSMEERASTRSKRLRIRVRLNPHSAVDSPSARCVAPRSSGLPDVSRLRQAFKFRVSGLGFRP